MRGGLAIGGGAPVTVQSMCNTKTWDVEATVAQIRPCGPRAATSCAWRCRICPRRWAISAIKERVDVPLVADIHFDYRLALECAARGIDKIRINPATSAARRR